MFLFCCTLIYVHSSIAIILKGKRELVASLNFSSWCLVNFVWLLLMVPWVCLHFVIVVFPDHTHLLFLGIKHYSYGITDMELSLFLPIYFEVKVALETVYRSTKLCICEK